MLMMKVVQRLPFLQRGNLSMPLAGGSAMLGAVALERCFYGQEQKWCRGLKKSQSEKINPCTSMAYKALAILEKVLEG